MTIARTVEKLIAPVVRRGRLLARRAVVKLVYDDPKMQELQLAIFAGEVRDHVERWEDYGFTSHPFPDAEALVLALGGNTDHCAVVKVADRRFRFRAIAEGEVVIYDDQGQAIHLKRDKTLHVYGVDHLMADIAVDTIVNCPDVTVNAETQVTLNTPLALLTGDLQVAGSITSTGTYGASGGKIQTPGDIESSEGEIIDQARSMSADRIIYNGHTHPGDSGGTTGTPNQQQ